MQAIISDIHGNLEALNAVLQDAATLGATSIVCLGDIIGYGPDPIACLELATSWDIVLAGNFEHAFLYEQTFEGWTARSAANSLIHFRDRLQNEPNGPRLELFVSELPQLVKEGSGFLCVHGSPRDPLYEYVYPEDVYNSEKMKDIWLRFDSLCFCGHTHIPGAIVSEWEFLTPNDCANELDVRDQKSLCNVGSVGQPRDGDNRACYVLFDGDIVRFRRVPYDYETTQRKIRDSGDDDSLGARLADGH